MRETTGCVTGDINGNGVTLTGQDTTPGTSATAGNGANGSKGQKGKTTKPKPEPTTPAAGAPNSTCPPGTLPEVCNTFSVIPAGAQPVPPPTRGTPAVTISDLKNFIATPGNDRMEPDGWMIVGLSTNFYSDVSTEVENGILLGRSASVRFTPIAWTWTYGDGASATLGTPGATWAAQGIQEFDPTPTSHVYAKSGTYSIDLSIQFSAQYKYANGNWKPVIGTLTIPANRLVATAGDAKTVLVADDCSEDPTGPGC
jgi:hypothetical protein